MSIRFNEGFPLGVEVDSKLPENTPLLPPADEKTLKAAEPFFRGLAKGNVPEVGFLASDVVGLSNISVINPLNDSSSDLGRNITTVASKVNSIFFGVLNFVRGKVFAEEGHKNHDSTRLLAGAFRMVRGGSEMIGGAANLTVGGIQIAQKANSFKDVVAGLTMVSLVGVSSVSLVIGSTSAAYLKEAHHIRSGFKEELKKGENEGYAFLEKTLNVGDEDLQKLKGELFAPKESWYQKSFGNILQRLFGDDKTIYAKKTKELVRKLINGEAPTPQEITDLKELKAKCGVIELKDQASLMGTEFLIKLNSDKTKESTSLDYERAVNEYKIELNGFVKDLCQIELDSLKAKKEAIFNRVFDVKINEKMKLDPSGEVKASIVKEAQAALKRNMAIHYIIVIGCSIAFVAGIVTEVLDHIGDLAGLPVVKIVELAFTILTSLMFFGIDAYFLYKAYTENEHTFKEKMIMIINTLAQALAGFAMIVLSKVAISSVKMILPLVILSIWIFTVLAGIYTAKRKQQTEPEVVTLTPKDSGLGTQGSAEITFEVNTA